MNKLQKDSRPPLVIKAEMALKKAVADVIEAHRRSGQPLAVWRNGRVVMIPSDQLTTRALQDQSAVSEKEGEPSRDS